MRRSTVIIICTQNKNAFRICRRTRSHGDEVVVQAVKGIHADAARMVTRNDTRISGRET